MNNFLKKSKIMTKKQNDNESHIQFIILCVICLCCYSYINVRLYKSNSNGHILKINNPPISYVHQNNIYTNYDAHIIDSRSYKKTQFGVTQVHTTTRLKNKYFYILTWLITSSITFIYVLMCLLYTIFDVCI